MLNKLDKTIKFNELLNMQLQENLDKLRTQMIYEQKYKE